MATVKLTKQNFDEVVGPSELVVVDFTADWCEPCQSFSPIFEELAKEYTDAVFAQVNVGEETELAADFNVRSVPTVMILRHHVAVFMQSGALTVGELKRLVEDAKALSMDAIQEHIQATIAKS